MLVGRAAIQKDLEVLEEWTDRSLTKFGKDKYQVLHQRWTNTLH